MLILRPLLHFNPRALVGRDKEFCLTPLGITKISIHAPSWGATGIGYDGSNGSAISIHAPSWGATEVDYARVRLTSFQSTRPRGARPLVRLRHRVWRDFNPRALVGRDLFYLVLAL